MNVDADGSLRAGAGAAGSDYVAAGNTKAHHAGPNTSVKGSVTTTLAAGGGEIQCVSEAHGRTTGEILAVQLGGEPVGSGQGTVYTITVVDANNFSLDGSAYHASLSETGTWELVENATDRWYPGVDVWLFVLARGGAVTFDAGCVVSVTGPAVRPASPPQEDEVIADGTFWAEGPVTTFKMKGAGGAARLVRGTL